MPDHSVGVSSVPALGVSPAPVILPEDAWGLLKANITPLPAVSVPLDDAVQCYLSTPLTSKHTVPTIDRVAVDGYAIFCEDTHLGSAELAIVPSGSAVGPGTCVPVITGDPIPEGATAVIRLDQANLKNSSSVCVNDAIPTGAHIIKKGHTAKEGEQLLTAGRRLRAGDIGICALAGYKEVTITQRPKVAIVAYGSGAIESPEIRDKSRLLNVTSPVLSSALKEALFDVVETIHVNADDASIATGIEIALASAEAVLITGGMSTHEAGPLPEIITSIGGTIHYNGVNLKPGRRQLFAEIGDSYVFGVPGNLLGGLVGLHEFVLPALRLLTGCPANECIPAIRMPLMRTVEVGGTKEHRILVKLQNTKYGPGLVPLIFSSSADATSAATADGTARIPIGRTTIAAGQYVEFRPWGSGNFSNQFSTIGDQYVGH